MDVLSIHCNRLEHLQERLLDLGFRRGEFYNFEPDHLPTLRQFIVTNNIVPSIHCPLRKAPWYPYPVTWSFLSTDAHEEEREMSFQLIEETMKDGRELGAAYVVVHYPTPASPEAHRMSLDRQREVAWESARRLHDLATEHGIPIHIEGFGPSPFMTTDFLLEVLRQFSGLRYCFDTGHVLLAAQRRELDYFHFLERLASHIGCVHVWNTRGPEDYKLYHHLPPHPKMKPEDGWVDMERVVATVRGASTEAVFVLEYTRPMPPELGLDHMEGIEWFKELVSSTPTSEPSRRNIVLSGFMGTGKTEVGRMVAAKLGRRFVDMDEVLIARTGMSIPAVFERYGEAFFREQERLLSRELAQEENLVIATGGGTLVSEENRRSLGQNGILICLQCAPEAIYQRLRQSDDRPMLYGEDLQTRIRTLLDQRQAAYDALPHKIDTTTLTIEQVAEAVIQIWRDGATRQQAWGGTHEYD